MLLVNPRRVIGAETIAPLRNHGQNNTGATIIRIPVAFSLFTLLGLLSSAPQAAGLPLVISATSGVSLNQSGNTVYGTGAVRITDYSHGLVQIPGLTASVISTGNELIYVSTYGGSLPLYDCNGYCSVFVDILLVVDGAFPTGGGFQRLNATPFGLWSMSQVMNLPPGTHTISVATRFVDAINTTGGAVVSGTDGDLIQGALTVLQLKL